MGLSPLRQINVTDYKLAIDLNGSLAQSFATSKTFLALSDEADFAEKDGGINSVTFCEASSHEATGSARDSVRLATGGEGGVLRVWEVDAAKRESRRFCHRFVVYLCPRRELVLSRLPLGIAVDTPNLRLARVRYLLAGLKLVNRGVFLTSRAIKLTVREGLRNSRRQTNAHTGLPV